MRCLTRSLAVAALLAAGACAATSNPDRSTIKPVAEPAAKAAPAGTNGVANSAANTPPSSAPKASAPAAKAATTSGTNTATTAAAQDGAKPAAPKSDGAAGQDASAGKAPQSDKGSAYSIGEVGGHPIDVREFLTRLWARDNRLAKEVLEQIAFARLALYEADRLGVQLAPERVDETVARTWAKLAEKLTAAGSKLSVEEHIAKVLDRDPDTYRQQLRTDAIVQLLAERCVRAWVLENERVVTRLTEARDGDTAAKIRSALDGGRAFADVALELGSGDDEATKTTSMVIVRSETQDLARLAFATPVGSVGGPLVQGQRFLFISVEQRLPPETGPWSTLGPKIEEDLVAHPVGDIEYVQWRATMMRRYQVDFAPFLSTVGEKP